MKNRIYMILAVFIFCVGCANRKYLIDKPQNFSQYINQYKSCKSELLDNKSIFPSTTIDYFYLKGTLTVLPENKLPAFRKLLKDNLLNKNKLAIYYESNGNLVDFYFKSVKSGFLVKILRNRKIITNYVISYDPKKSWLERQSIIGVTDDSGISELIEVEKDWYFVKYWNLEE